jgi:penicillin amidase
MLPEQRHSRRVRRIVRAAIALGASVVLLTVLGAGYGPVPGLGPALDPGHGAWTSVSGGLLPRSQTLSLRGLAHPAQATFSAQGIAAIHASSDSDLFEALGYVHARFRLTQMDLERRLGEGRLAQLAGSGGVASDKFELQLGLLRTARKEWASMPPASPAARALTAYARGVNDYLASVRASRQWPAVFSLAGVYPATWTPVDSLVVQGVLTQQLDFTTTPLDYAVLERSLGARRTMAWFPVLAPGQHSPFDRGPYRNLGMAPLQAGTSVTSGGPAATSDSAVVTSSVAAGEEPAARRSAARGAAAILAQVSALPAGQVHQYPDSNAWAASGPKVASGGALLAGDPHLPQTLPSTWYEVALSAPGMAVTGVSLPGMPGVLLGHNTDIAWSLTDTQNQSAMFYDEKTSKTRPAQYFWRGQWRRMRQIHYTIPVRGGASQRLTVDLTVHGPVLTRTGQTIAVDWMGALPSPDLAVLLRISHATNYAQFRSALAGWRSPTQNFVYADRHGNIGAISAGYFPLVRHGRPWLPMPGTGADDVAGVIPFAAVPQAYNPPGHVIATANQRPVGDSYPYYIGTSANDFDPGYRAAQEYAYLGGHSKMKPASFADLQASLSDGLARQIVPRLRAALRHAKMTPTQREAELLLATWNYWTGAKSAAASVWWTFWTSYLSAVFQPWWTAGHVPVQLDRAGLAVGPEQFSLDELLASWTMHDRGNAAFGPPDKPGRGAAAVMRAAFSTAVAHLESKLGGPPDGWTWGKLHGRQFRSLTGAAGLATGPTPSGGDPWTVNAADGGLVATAGPSWRMIAGWSHSGRPTGEGIYPGGQSENPASPWYDNLAADWQAGRYLPLPDPAGVTAGGAASAGGAGAGGAGASAGTRAGGAVQWELVP